MSAAAPPPPWQPGAHNGAANPTTEYPFPHIQDLQSDSLQGYNRNDSIENLLKIAEAGFTRSQHMIQNRRPDLAYVDYVRASELVGNVIPSHAGYPEFSRDTREREHSLQVLQRKIFSMIDQFDNIKEIIVRNNQRTGILPRGYQAATGHARSQSEVDREEAMRAPPPYSNANRRSANGSLTATNGQRIKPSVSPKPESLHGRELSNVSSGTNGSVSTSNSEALNERFQKLRLASGPPERPDSRASISSVHSSPISMPSARDFNGRESFDALTKKTSLNGKPQGPRGMTNGLGGPVLPAKLPLDTQLAAAMPKEPSPTYSPARNMQTMGNIAPPRHSARSLAGTDVRRSSMASVSSASARAPNGLSDSGDYFPSPTSNGRIPEPPQRRKSVHVPKESRISAERLYDYLPRFTILLIDVRSRAEFDQGHIFSRNVICIEPMTLTQGISAEQLFDSLVLSPEGEQEIFQNRHMFDLVVYYDTSTQSESYISRPTSEKECKLKHLHEALYDFNQDKPLQRPPILLAGGLDAWVDLVGQQSLATTSTFSRTNPGQGALRRPSAITHGSSELHVPKRRLRDYNPLEQEEHIKWLERARQESVSVSQPPTLEGEADGEGQEEDDVGLRTVIQQFNERFPEAGAIDRQPGFMSSQLPSRAPPVPPAKVPQYPPAPVQSAYPQAPKRPMPAASRMSYTGVSDRVVSQPSRDTSQLAPYIPAKYIATNLRLPRTGLVNFGVTCYMNATLQCLSATTPLTIFFLDDHFRSLVQRDNWKGSKGVMPELYSTVIRSLWKGDVESIKPTTFRSFCGRLNREWSIDRQQDAKEFFDFLLDCLHEDLNTMWARTPLRALTEEEEARRERMPKTVVAKTEWSRYTHREQSFLTQLFGGQHASRLRCTTCGFTSTTYEAFYSISVEIPPSGHSTLQDCLRSYCAEERLSGDEVWKCPNCKKEREATKQITITRAPQFLVVHFKRFSASHHQSARKVRTLIDFPLNNLNLEPYMLPYSTDEQAQAVAQNQGAQDLRTDPSMTPPYIYDAYGVMRHIGTTLTSGHYTSAVKDRARQCWRMFNDTRVTDFQPENLSGTNKLQNEEAYIVFYQRTEKR